MIARHGVVRSTHLDWWVADWHLNHVADCLDVACCLCATQGQALRMAMLWLQGLGWQAVDGVFRCRLLAPCCRPALSSFLSPFCFAAEGEAVCDEQRQVQVPHELLVAFRPSAIAFLDQNFAVGFAGVCSREEEPLV